MNQLSWMLYFADLLPSIGCFAWICFVLALICVVLWLLIAALRNDKCYEDDERWKYGKYNRQFLTILAISAFVGVVIPGKETMYAIAASQMGEQALKTPLAIKAEKALEAWLDKQTASK